MLADTPSKSDLVTTATVMTQSSNLTRMGLSHVSTAGDTHLVTTRTDEMADAVVEHPQTITTTTRVAVLTRILDSVLLEALQLRVAMVEQQPEVAG
jgi:hypothetical protein